MKDLLKENWPLVLILLMALIIRVVGVKPGYPPYHPDEQMSYITAIKMIENQDFHPHRFDYPAGVPLVHLLFYKTIFMPLALIRQFILEPGSLLTAIRFPENFSHQFSQSLFGWRHVNALFFSRYLTAIMGTSDKAK